MQKYNIKGIIICFLLIFEVKYGTAIITNKENGNISLDHIWLSENILFKRIESKKYFTNQQFKYFS